MSKVRFKVFSVKNMATACVLAGFAFFNACSPDSGIGNNVLPENNTLTAKFVDTSTVQTSLVLEDTIPTSNNTSEYLLGSYTDPIFGTTKASFYTQLLFPYNVNPFVNYPTITLSSANTTEVILDSVVLSMPYGVYSGAGYYGTLGAQTVQVYLMDTGSHFVADSAYYSDANLSHKIFLGEKTIIPQMTTPDSVCYPYYHYAPADSFQYASNPRLTVKLNYGWGLSWFDSAFGVVSQNGKPFINTITQSLLSSSSEFQTHLRGIYITVSNPMQFPGQGALWYMNPYTSVAGVVFYCRVIGPNPNIPGQTCVHYITPTFGISQGCLSFAHFDHDYTNTVFNGPKNKKDSVYSPNYIYVQGLGGVKTKIKFPYLMNWIKKGPIIVNRAEVDIPVDESDIGQYNPPSQVYLVGINDTSTVASTATYTLPDQASGYYGGTYDAFNHMYVFDIAQYVQGVLDKKTIDAGLYLVQGSPVDASRFVGYGGKGVGPSSSQRLRLKLYYTPLKK
jgi:hypothetical protein